MMTEREIYQKVKAWLDPREWAILPQVRNATGFDRKTRYADAIAISCFPSKGIGLHGFEFKDSRADWLRELKDGSKSDEIGSFCAQWSVVVSAASIVKPEEVPEMWGWIVIEDGALKVKKKAPRRPASEPTWTFFAALMRAAMVATPEADLAQQINAAVEKERQRMHQVQDEAVRKERDRVAKDNIGAAAIVSEFEKASGISMFGYGRNAKKIGEAVKFILEGGLKFQSLEYARNSANAVVRDIDKVLTELKVEAKPDPEE